MANPKSPFVQPAPAAPVARYKGAPFPPNVVPSPGPLSRMKASLPKLPSVTQLFHKPRLNNRSGLL